MFSYMLFVVIILKSVNRAEQVMNRVWYYPKNEVVYKILGHNKPSGALKATEPLTRVLPDMMFQRYRFKDC